MAVAATGPAASVTPFTELVVAGAGGVAAAGAFAVVGAGGEGGGLPQPVTISVASAAISINRFMSFLPLSIGSIWIAKRSVGCPTAQSHWP